jgi:hypothetical protein
MAVAAEPATLRTRRPVIRPAARWVAARAGQVAGWRVNAAIPGLAGAGLVSAGLALRFGVWAGLICGGVFCLIIDRRAR